jgi:hypothetical protein
MGRPAIVNLEPLRRSSSALASLRDAAVRRWRTGITA